VPEQFTDMQPATVVEVVDGDTLAVEVEGATATVRLIGVDTPETKDPNEPVGCFGPEASEFTAQQVAIDSLVYLEQDVSETD
jgi:micrococcal nuclease